MQEVLAAAPAAEKTATRRPSAAPAEAEPEREVQPWAEVIEEEEARSEAGAPPAPQEAPPVAAEAATGPQLRFAEDLVTVAVEDKKKKKSKKAETKVEEPAGKAKKVKRARRPVIEDEEMEDFEV